MAKLEMNMQMNVNMKMKMGNYLCYSFPHDTLQLGDGDAGDEDAHEVNMLNMTMKMTNTMNHGMCHTTLV